MFKINYIKILLFFGKIILMILLNIPIGYVFWGFVNLRNIMVIIFSVYFVINLYIFMILYTKKVINILKNIDIILLGSFLIIFVGGIILMLIFINPIEAASHGGLFYIPVGFTVIYFFIAYVIDKLIIKKLKEE